MSSQILTALLLYSLSQFILLGCEISFGFPIKIVEYYIIGFRVSIAIVCLCSWAIIWNKVFIGTQIPLLLTYGLIGLLFYLMSSITSSIYDDKGILEECPYLFFSGMWSTGNSLVFTYMCFNSSGLLFSDAATVSGLYTFFITISPFLFFPLSSLRPLSTSIYLLPAFHFFEILYVHSVEMETRTRYLNQLEAGRDLCRQDKLISSILPSDISLALKHGNTKIERLASYYSDVTILFCYIVDFAEHSSVNHPQDTVELCRRIVSVFDRIVEQTGAYKVENIADTYMVCAGCPTKSINHMLVVARTALAMMKAAEIRCWKWPDSSPVRLKIGIHTGPISAGVVGTKSYSYHLFGDSVNTASRMCSHSLPGKVLLSTQAYQKLISDYEDIFHTSERGEFSVKGKGMMRLYWLDGYLSQYVDMYAVNLNHQSDKRSYTDRYAQLRASESVKITVNRYTLRFDDAEKYSLGNISNRAIVPSDSGANTKILSGFWSIELSLASDLPDRRGSRVSHDAAAAISAGLTRMLSRRIESLSPREYQYDSEVTGKIPATPNSVAGESLKEMQGKIASPIREFESLHDEDEPGYDIFKQKELTEDIDSKCNEPRGLKSESQNLENTTIDIAKNMEKSFQIYYDQKSYYIQLQTLVMCVIFTFLNVLFNISHDNPWRFPCFRLLLLLLVLSIMKFWNKFRFYSQNILLLIEFIILGIRIFEVRQQGGRVGVLSICILFILFTTIFLRMRFHYVLVYLIYYIFVGFAIVVVLHSQPDDHSTTNREYNMATLLYSVITLIVSVWLTYIQELTARTEFVDLFIMREEMRKTEQLLSNMLPSRENAFQLLKGELILDDLNDVTLLYSDIKGFTPLSSHMHPKDLCELLNDIYSAFDKHLSVFGMYKVDIIGDAFVVIGGMPGYKDRANHARNTILFAFHMLEDIRIIRQKYNVDLEIRIGIHTGGCLGSVISVNKPRYLIWGPNSIIANYLESSGVPGSVHISEHTMQKLEPGSLNILGVEVIERGEIDDKKNLLNSESTYLLSCKDFSELQLCLSGKIIDPVHSSTTVSRFSVAMSQIALRRFGGNRHRALTIDTTLLPSATNSSRATETDSRRERSSSDPHGVRSKRSPDSPHSSMLQTAIASSYFGGHSGRKSLSSVSTDSGQPDLEHGTTASVTSVLRKRLDSNESVNSNPSHTSSPRGSAIRRPQPFEEIHTNFGTTEYKLLGVTYNLPKGWAKVESQYQNNSSPM